MANQWTLSEIRRESHGDPSGSPMRVFLGWEPREAEAYAIVAAVALIQDVRLPRLAFNLFSSTCSNAAGDTADRWSNGAISTWDVISTR